MIKHTRNSANLMNSDINQQAEQDNNRSKMRLNEKRLLSKESGSELLAPEKSPRGSQNPSNLAGGREGAPNIKVGSDKSSEHSSNIPAVDANNAKIIQEELKADVKSCKFCHVVPPRKKVKYPS